jgi:hypothetical protein
MDLLEARGIFDDIERRRGDPLVMSMVFEVKGVTGTSSSDGA